MTHHDVAIVGCGPSGATLANLLRSKGHSVVIFDRDTEVFHAPRAMVIDPESCRIYQQLGILDRLLVADACPFRLHRFVSASRRLLLDLDFATLAPLLGYPAMGLMFHQPALEALLREDFASAEGGGRVDALLGKEVLEVTSEEDGARIQAQDLATGEVGTWTAQWVVGADGGASLCRRAIGAERVDLEYQRRWMVIDIIVHDRALWDGLREGSEFMCREDAAVVFVKGHHGHVRFDFEIDEASSEQFSADDALALIGDYFDTASVEIIRLQPYNFYAGMPDRWRSGRVLLAGDAAHQTSPFAGQGLNMGIRDAAHLAFLFDMVLCGQAGPDLLDSYQEERWEHCRLMIDRASRGGRLISSGGVAGHLRNLGFTLARFSKAHGAQATERAVPQVAPLRDGLIGAGHNLCGRRLEQPEVVDASGQRQRLDQVVGNGFVLLLWRQESDPAIDWFCAELGGRVCVVGQDLQDPEAALAGFTGGGAVLVRPDRYIVAAGPRGADLCSGLRETLLRYRAG